MCYNTIDFLTKITKKLHIMIIYNNVDIDNQLVNNSVITLL